MTSINSENKHVKKFEGAIKVISALFMFGLVLITFVDVIGRKFGYPLAFAFEFTQVAVALMFYTTLPLVALRRENVFVDLLPLPKNKRWEAAVEAAIFLFCAFIVVFGAYQLWQHGVSLERFRTVMMFTRWPIAPFVYFMSVAASVTAIVFLHMCVGKIKKCVNGPHEDNS